MTHITEIAARIVELIAPLSSEERQRVTRAALLLAGESVEEKSTGKMGTAMEIVDVPFTASSSVWIKQNSLSKENLEEVFHFVNGAANIIISSIPGKGQKEQTTNTYLLVGISNLLTSGNPTIDDKIARSVCTNMGCFNSNHHAEYLAEKGNLFTGTKKDGWVLTAPGLKAAGLLIKEITDVK